MVTAVSYDVIVLGAGISGLLIASELSRDLRVLVLEQQPEIPRRKYWATNLRSSELNPELKEFVDTTYDSLDFIAHDHTTYSCHGKFALWDTNALTDHLIQRVTQYTEIRTGITFYSYRYSNNSVRVSANDLELSAKLLIDCMGHQSPIVSGSGILDVAGYYVISGALLELRSNCPAIGLYNAVMSSHPKYFEIFPTKSGHAYTVLISPEHSIKPEASLRDEFRFLVERSRLSRYFVSGQEIDYTLGGILPVGRMKKDALNRVFFFGEAGQVNPAASGTAMTRMLYCYKKLGRELSSCVFEDRLSGSQLSHAGGRSMTEYIRRLHLLLYKRLLRMNSVQFKNLVMAFQELGNAAGYNLFFGDSSSDEALRPSFLYRALLLRQPVLAEIAIRAMLPI